MAMSWYHLEADGRDIKGDEMIFFNPDKGYKLSTELESIPELASWNGKREDFYPIYVLGWEFEGVKLCERFPCPDPQGEYSFLYHATTSLVAYYIEPYWEECEKQFPYMKKRLPILTLCGDDKWRIVLLRNMKKAELKRAKKIAADGKYWATIGKLLDIEEPPKWYIHHWTKEQRKTSIRYTLDDGSGEEDLDEGGEEDLDGSGEEDSDESGEESSDPDLADSDDPSDESSDNDQDESSGDDHDDPL